MGANASSDHQSSERSGSNYARNYSGVEVRDNGKGHFGDVIYHGDVHITHNGSSSQQPVATLVTPVSGLQTWLGKRKRSPDDSGEGSHRTQEYALDAALGRLGAFSTSLRHERLDEDARETIERLSAILDALGHCESTAGHVGGEWDKPKKCVMVANRVMVNHMSPWTVRANLDRIERKRDTIQFGQWVLSLTTTVFCSRDELGRTVTETSSAIRVEPSTQVAGPFVNIVLGERTDYFGRSFIHPTMVTQRIVRNESPIFDMIRQDDVDGLIGLFAEQEATTRDCDEDNRALLSVSGSIDLIGRG
jgi:hypothetical protein